MFIFFFTWITQQNKVTKSRHSLSSIDVTVKDQLGFRPLLGLDSGTRNTIWIMWMVRL